MSESPEEIRRRIEETRADLSANVDAVGDTLDPRQIAHRQADRVRSRVDAVRDRVMGTVQDVRGSGDAGDSVRSAAGSAVQDAKDAPGVVAEKARGNPLAAGLIAFGVGWLASSLLPASSREQHAAQAVKEQAQAALPEVKEAARQVADDLRAPAQEAVQAVKDRASDAAAEVKEHGTQAVADLRDQAQDSVQQVREAPQQG